jgi:ppGpp synthetase/RelA/SpoT-type nucleotidyltranferase
VIVRHDGLPVEIQVRTDLQDRWAQVFERLGDVWGRSIRYGGDPEPVPDDPGASAIRQEIVHLMSEMSDVIADQERTYYPIKATLDRIARIVSEGP